MNPRPLELESSSRPPVKLAWALTLLAALLMAAPSARAQQSPDLEQMSSMLSVMGGFFNLMAAVHEMASNPETAALLQMHEIEEIYKNQGKLADAIPVYEEVLKRTTNPTVRAMAYMRLADAMKKLGRTTESVDVLKRALDESLDQIEREGG